MKAALQLNNSNAFTLLWSKMRSSTISSAFRERLKACSSSMSSAGRLPTSEGSVTGLLDNAVFTVTKQRRSANCKNTKLVLEHYIPPWQKVVLASSQLHSGLNPAPSCSLPGLKHRKGCAEPTEQQYLGQDNPTTIWRVHMLSAEARNVRAFHFYFFNWST